MTHVRSLMVRLAVARDGAVAPLTALTLIGLVAAGGLAVDYARVVNLDTELQNAADQAALAAVTQLDGTAGACQRARDAAAELIQNQTKFANDGGEDAVTFLAPTFYRNKDRLALSTEGEGEPTESDCDSQARAVEVRVVTRTARYAFTPVVGALSGDASAAALAAMGSAMCRTPPLMMCNPAEPDGNEDDLLDSPIAAGTGILLTNNTGGGSAWSPGSFGFIDVAVNATGPTLVETFSMNAPTNTCISLDGVDIQTGNHDVSDAINTRFDVYNGGSSKIGLCSTTRGDCSPAPNTVKDLVRGKDAPEGVEPGSCGLDTKYSDKGEWIPPSEAEAYIPGRAAAAIKAMGHPRDKCHAYPKVNPTFGGYACSGKNNRIGDGSWDRDTYFAVNHPSVTTEMWQADLGTAPTRYQVYQWELAQAATRLAKRDLVLTDKGKAYNYRRHSAPICGAGPAATDRRVVSVAVINCQAEEVNGGENDVTVAKWLDVFLVEPAVTRPTGTESRDIYVEVIRENKHAGEGAPAQMVRRDVPFLVE